MSKEEIIKDFENYKNRVINLMYSALEKYWLKKDQLERRISVSKPQEKIVNNLIESKKYENRLKYILKQNLLKCSNEIESLL